MNRITLFIISILLNIYYVSAQTPANDTHWKIEFDDHFTNLNTNKWWVAHYYGKDTPHLHLHQCVSIEGSNLKLEVNNTEAICPNQTPLDPPWLWYECDNGKVYHYTSGVVHASFNISFGYIESKMKLPFRRENNKSWGIYPNFWTILGLNEPLGSSACEIDIFEMFSDEYNKPNTLNTCIHTCYDPGCDEGQSRSHELSNFDFTDWHTYAIEWDANRIIWYVDGKAIRTLNNHGIIDPIRLIFGIAIDIRPSHQPPKSPVFREYMYVDYVKVYKLKCDKNTVVNEISNFNTYDYAVKKSIAMSNLTSIPSGSDISLRATDFIELKPGFEVQTGRTLYLDVTPCVFAGTVGGEGEEMKPDNPVDG